MIMIAGTVRFPADRIRDARDAMARMIEATRAEDGCVHYAFAEDVLDPGLIHISELWRDQAALERHGVVRAYGRLPKGRARTRRRRA